MKMISSLKRGGLTVRDQDGVEAAQLGVDLQAEVGQHLGGRPRHVQMIILVLINEYDTGVNFFFDNSSRTV